MFDNKTLSIYSIIVGTIFTISGLFKVFDTASFGDLIVKYGFNYLSLLAPLICIVEIALGLALVLLINPKRYSMYSFFLLLIFTISFTYAYILNGINDCGCFGTFQHTKIPPFLSFIRNFVLIALTVVLWIKYPKNNKVTIPWKKKLMLMIIFPVIFISGYTFHWPLSIKNDYIVHKFHNQHIKDTKLANYFYTSPDSTYLIFCFSYTSYHCWNSIANLQQFSLDGINIKALATGKQQDQLFLIRSFIQIFTLKICHMMQ